ncbi:MAG: amidohydrolase [Phycisphaerales bacterium]|nr:amidohydrolase [Phycisphaerales bacterium]
MSERNDASAQLPTSDYVDAHVHVWTTDFERYPLAAGFSQDQMSPPSFTPDDVLALARPLGVRRIVLIQMNFYGFDNSYMLDCMRQHPGVFSGIAQVDEHGAGPACEMRRLKAQGVRGVRIFPSRRGMSNWLDGPGMHAMWSTAAEERLAMCPLIDADDLVAVDRMCGKFLDTPVVIDHCARIGGDGKFRDSDIQRLCSLARHKQVDVKLSAFYFLGAKQPPYTDVLPMIRCLLDSFGPERLMWATDSPFQVMPPHSYKASLELIRDRLEFASPSDRQWILERTAAKLFFD